MHKYTSLIGGFSKLKPKPTLASNDLLHPQPLFRGFKPQNSIRTDDFLASPAVRKSTHLQQEN
jgi:hypothetical protein